MNESLTLLKTENPAWLTAAFEQSASADPAFLRAYQKQHFEAFTRRGLPTRREEAWKYCDLSFLEQKDYPSVQQPQPLPESETLKTLLADRARDHELLVFVNGVYAPQLSSVSSLPKGVILCSLQEAMTKHSSLITSYLLKEIDADQYPFASLNAAFFTDGLFVYIPSATVLERPLHLLSLSLGSSAFMANPRHLLILENEAHLNLTEEYHGEKEVGPAFTNVCADFFLGSDASIHYQKIQNDAPSAKHVATLSIHQKQNSQVDVSFFSVGGQFIRNEVTVHLQEAHAQCQARGFYGLDRDGQFIDNHVYMNHAAPHTKSDLDYRGLVSGRSRAVFNGKVRVSQAAKKTEARQLNHNLLLSPLGEVDSKPELEIYADEVQCRHGATLGQLDEEALFYLRSRGLDAASAKMILVQAFVETILNEVPLPYASALMRDLWGRQLATL